MSSSPRQAIRFQSWGVSLLIHALPGAWILWSLWTPSKQADLVEIEVYDQPVQTTQPITIQKPKPKPKPKPIVKKTQAVSGVSRKAVLGQDQAQELSFKKGNTIAKEKDNKVLKESDADELPIPTAEYMVTTMPRLVEEVRVPYPAEAKSQGIEGPVVMDLLIDERGLVRQVDLISGLGYGLDEAAIAALKQFKFSPARAEAKAVAVRIRYTYRFVLER